jgi:hypothetical protein
VDSWKRDVGSVEGFFLFPVEASTIGFGDKFPLLYKNTRIITLGQGKFPLQQIKERWEIPTRSFFFNPKFDGGKYER